LIARPLPTLFICIIWHRDDESADLQKDAVGSFLNKQGSAIGDDVAKKLYDGRGIDQLTSEELLSDKLRDAYICKANILNFSPSDDPAIQGLITTLSTALAPQASGPGRDPAFVPELVTTAVLGAAVIATPILMKLVEMNNNADAKQAEIEQLQEKAKGYSANSSDRVKIQLQIDKLTKEGEKQLGVDAHAVAESYYKSLPNVINPAKNIDDAAKKFGDVMVDIAKKEVAKKTGIKVPGVGTKIDPPNP
jgi:hypothetical protein